MKDIKPHAFKTLNQVQGDGNRKIKKRWADGTAGQVLALREEASFRLEFPARTYPFGTGGLVTF